MYIVLEIQKNADGQIGTLVYTYDKIADAYHGYFTVAAAAAISTLPLHAVTLMTEVGSMLRNESFDHTALAAIDADVTEVEPEE